MDYSNIINALSNSINEVFIFFCAILVLLMQLGFAMLEAGLNSYKNTANILFKNLADLCIAAIIFYFIGYHIIFHDSGQGFTLNTKIEGIKWFYQMAFAATAATIVSGAVAGRMQFKAYLLFSAFISGIVFPIVARLCWEEKSFFGGEFEDLAGSVVVHGVGGVAALAAVIMLRPRQGRYIEGFQGHHNLGYALFGSLILWVGWYGFNAGSIGQVLEIEYDTVTGFVSLKKTNLEAFRSVAINTTLGGAAGALGGVFLGLVPYRKKLNLKAAMNGALGGLVSVTASCNQIEPAAALFIGLVAGLLVVFFEMVMDLKKLRLDDTVGAIPVHAVCGIWGGLSVAIFSSDPTITLFVQFSVITISLGGVFIVMLLFFYLLKKIGWLEVTLEEEKKGLDQVEHGLDTYLPKPKSD